MVLQPTLGDIINIGESKFYSTLHIFVSNTTTWRLKLWDMGIDWNEFSDFDLFIMLYKGIDPDVSKLLFGELNWNDFQIYTKKDTDGKESASLYNPVLGIEINESVYHHFSQYLQNVFNMFPEEKITYDKTMKKWFIDKDRREEKRNAEKEAKGKKETSSIQSIISTCVNHPGFKYKLKELVDVGVCEFYDSVQRLQIYEQSTAVLKGMYSGFVDASKINPDAYNFMKNIKG